MMIELLEPEASAIAEYNPVAAGLAELKRKYANVAVDVSTFKALEEAKRVRAEIREPRYETEKIRKALKAPALAHAKLIDTEAARITAELLAIEGPWDEAIKTEEARKEEERKAREAAERKRVTDIHARIGEIKEYAALALGCRTSAKVGQLKQAMTDKWVAYNFEDDFQEFGHEAQAAFDATAARMSEIHDAKATEEAERARVAQEQEAERQRLAEERAALDRQRAEQARADKEAADKRAAEEKRLADERAALEQQRADLERRQAAAAVVDDVLSTLVEPAIVTGPVSAFEQEVQAMAEAIGATGTTNVPAMTHPNGAPMYSTTTFKDNGEPIMLDANGKRSVFCDIADDMPALPPVKRPSAEDIALAVAQRFFATFDEAAHWLKTTDFSTL